MHIGLAKNVVYDVADLVKCTCKWKKKCIQATPAMSTSRISIPPLMSKWFFIPNIFSLYFFAFQLRLCRKRLTWSNGYLEVIFHAFALCMEIHIQCAKMKQNDHLFLNVFLSVHYSQITFTKELSGVFLILCKDETKWMVKTEIHKSGS